MGGGRGKRGKLPALSFTWVSEPEEKKLVFFPLPFCELQKVVAMKKKEKKKKSS